MKVYDFNARDLTCTDNSSNWFEIPVPQETIILRFVVAEQATLPGAFSAALYRKKVIGDTPAWKLAINRVIPPTAATSGVVSVIGTWYPAMTVTSAETGSAAGDEVANPRTLWLNVTGSGLATKKFSVSLSSIVGGARQ